MAGAKPAWSAALVLVTIGSAPAWAADPGSAGVQGFVADARGTPAAGALISVFGNGLRGGGLITFSDEEGRFALSGLPAGSYTLRAVGRDRRPAPARRITVVPNTRAYFSMSLAAPAFGQTTLGEGIEVSADDESAPALGAADGTRAGDAAREARWMLRHRKRSVLEEQGPSADVQAQRASLAWTDPSRPAELGGRLDVMANATAVDDTATASSWDAPSSFGVLRLDGRLADNVTWSLGGLVAESENTSWRMAAEFVIDPGGGHQVEAGSGYGSGMLRPRSRGQDAEGREGAAGVIFARDTFALTRELSASLGARWSYLGFLRASNYMDPAGWLAWKRGRHAVQATASVHTLSPGGDLLTLSSLSTAPPITYAVMDPGLRAERVTRYEIAVTSSAGALLLGARAFREGTRDQLVNLFDDGAPDGLRILNARGGVSKGVGLSLGRRLGRAVNGSLAWQVGVARRDETLDTATWPHPVDSGLFARDARFQDLVARLETLVDRSDTRVVAYYRLNTVTPDDGRPSRTSARFDVQLNQGLPFLTSLTRADWELLVAFRNLFYEESEGGVLDEIAVHNPPKRIVGGVSVRF